MGHVVADLHSPPKRGTHTLTTTFTPATFTYITPNRPNQHERTPPTCRIHEREEGYYQDGEVCPPTGAAKRMVTTEVQQHSRTKQDKQ